MRELHGHFSIFTGFHLDYANFELTNHIAYHVENKLLISTRRKLISSTGKLIFQVHEYTWLPLEVAGGRGNNVWNAVCRTLPPLQYTDTHLGWKWMTKHKRLPVTLPTFPYVLQVTELLYLHTDTHLPLQFSRTELHNKIVVQRILCVQNLSFSANLQKFQMIVPRKNSTL